MATFRDATAPGSYLALSHGTGDYRLSETGRAAEIYQNTQTPGTFRSRAHITSFFAGYDLVEPGLIDVIYWRPDPEATDLSDPLDRDVARYSLLGGVGRKP